MRVLVTGAQGCIGAWTVKNLLDRGFEIVTYDLDTNPSRLSLIASDDEIKRVNFETGEIENTGRIKNLVRDGGITHIVHLAAALIPVCQAHPVKGALANVIGTLNVFEAVRDAGRPVRVVYASSAAVLGPEEVYGVRSVSESDALLPQTHYGVFKQANENNARVFHATDGISSIGLRPWSVYGLGRDHGLTAAPTTAAKAVVLKRPFHIPVSGHMDLQYVEDVAAVFVQALLSGLEGAHVFNLSGDIIEMNDYVRTLEELRPGAASLISAGGKPIPVAHKLDASQVRKLIPGIPHTTLKEGLERTLNHFERLEREGRLPHGL